ACAPAVKLDLGLIHWQAKYALEKNDPRPPGVDTLEQTAEQSPVSDGLDDVDLLSQCSTPGFVIATCAFSWSCLSWRERIWIAMYNGMLTIEIRPGPGR